MYKLHLCLHSFFFLREEHDTATEEGGLGCITLILFACYLYETLPLLSLHCAPVLLLRDFISLSLCSGSYLAKKIPTGMRASQANRIRAPWRR